MSEPMTPERVRALLEAAAQACGGDVPRLTAEDFAEDGWAPDVSPLFCAAPDLARAYLAEHERAKRAESALEEREGDMHARIRAGYDSTVADAWRAEVARVAAERDAAEQRAQRAEAEAARLREVVDAARAAADALTRAAVGPDRWAAPVARRLRDALARLDGGG